MRKQVLTRVLTSRFNHWRSLLSLLFLGISLVSFTDDTHKPSEQERNPSTVRPIKKQPVHPFDADPIKFLIRADKQTVSPGEEVTITVTAHYLNIHSALLFTAVGSNAFRLKALLPDGFVQTGGDYSDYIGTELSATHPTATYTIKGYFSKADNRSEFRLLRGSYYADASSLFVEKARLVIQVHAAEMVRNQQKSARSGGALAFQIVSYNCNSGQLQYQFTGGDGSPINVSLPGIFGGTMYADVVSNYTFPGDALVGRTMTGSATQSGNQLTINFTNGCNMTTNPSPPANPNPPSGNCSYSEGQYLFTFNSEAMYAHYYNGVLYAAYQNGSEFRPQHWLVATGLMDTNRASCFAENDPHNGGTTNHQRTPIHLLTLAATQRGQYLFTFNSEVMYAHYYNGVLYAGYQNGSEFRPQHWLIATGLMNANTASCFAENDPHNGGPNTGSGNVGGGVNNPVGDCSINRPHSSIDAVGEQGIYGWALDESDFGKTVIVDIYVDGTKVASVPANEDRADLVAAFGNNTAARYHGFNASITNLRSVSKSYSISIQICGTTNPLWSGQLNVSGRSNPDPNDDPDETVDCGTLPEIVVKAKKVKWGYPVCHKKNDTGSPTGSPGNNPGTNPSPDIPPATNPDTPSGTTPGGTGGGNPGTNPNHDPNTGINYTNQPVPTKANLEGIDCDKISGWAFATNGVYAYLDIYIADVYGILAK